MLVSRAARILRAKFQALSRGGFVHSVGMLVGGTVFAQAVTVLALPLISRLYTPLDFSALAVFVSVLAIVSVSACLRFEIAIPLPESDEDAANLLALALCICSAVAVLTGAAVWWFAAQIVSMLGQPALRPYLWLLPVGVWLTSAYAAVQFWSTRKRRFGIIAKTRMSQAIGGAGAQIGLGWAGFAPFGLLFGQVISSGAGLLGQGRNALSHDRTTFHAISLTGMHRVLRQYDHFPKYSALEALANTAGIQLPIIIIAALASGPEAGYLMLAMRAMAAPMGLIGAAVSQVYLSRAPEELRAGRLAQFTSQIIGGLSKSGIGPLIFAGIVSPLIFPIIFGEKWQRAGELVAWMTPWFVLQFLASPVSMTLHITGNQRTALSLQLVGLAMRLGAIGISAWIAPNWIVESYALSSFLFYCIYLHVVARVSKIKKRELFLTFSNAVKIIFLWVLAGVIYVAITQLLAGL